MSSTDIVIKIDSGERPAKKRRPDKPTSQPGVLVIQDPPSAKGHETPKEERETGVMVVASIDIKGTRLEILGNWRSYTPAKIVGIFREHYSRCRLHLVFNQLSQGSDLGSHVSDAHEVLQGANQEILDRQHTHTHARTPCL